MYKYKYNYSSSLFYKLNNNNTLGILILKIYVKQGLIITYLISSFRSQCDSRLRRFASSILPLLSKYTGLQ